MTGPAGSSARLGGIQMQLTGGAHRIIDYGQPVIFDTAVNDQSSDIGYNPLTGAFALVRPGNYFISWWVATDGSESSTNLWFSVDVNAGGSSAGATPIVTGQLSGSSLVTVGAIPASLSLRNAANDAVALASTPVKANIIILQVS